MKFSVTIAVACTAAGVSAHAATLTATPANLAAQVAAAQPGDTVRMSAGSYGQVNLQNIKKTSPGVTIMPAQGAAVTMIGLNTNGSTWLTFDGLDIGMTKATGNSLGLMVQWGAANQTFRHLKVHAIDGATVTGQGGQVRDASNITIDSSEFAWVVTGLQALDSHFITFSNNVFHDLWIDAIDMAGTTDSKVIGNTGTDIRPPPGAHPDFIQWWGTAMTPTNNLDIEDNHYTRGANGAGVQGIFGEDGVNITIKGNTLVGPMFNGIGLSRSVGVTIQNNFLQSYSDMGTRIIVRDACDQVTISENTAPAVFNYNQAREKPCKSVTIGNNRVLKAVGSPGDDKALKAFRAASGKASAAPAADPPKGSAR